MQRILSNWNAIRFFRLVLGLTIVVQAVFTGDWMMGIFGVVFTSMPLFNTGCCGTQACAMPEQKTADPAKDIQYEEVVK